MTRSALRGSWSLVPDRLDDAVACKQAAPGNLPAIVIEAKQHLGIAKEQRTHAAQ
jgi:hypothetical protein